MVGFGREPELMEIPEPVAGPGEVVIKVGGAGRATPISTSSTNSTRRGVAATHDAGP